MEGPIDTPENRAEFPKGFAWDCCDEPGDEEGCEKGFHVERDWTRKRVRY